MTRIVDSQPACHLTRMPEITMKNVPYPNTQPDVKRLIQAKLSTNFVDGVLGCQRVPRWSDEHFVEREQRVVGDVVRNLGEGTDGEIDFVFYDQYVSSHLLWPRAWQGHVTAR